MKLYLHCGYHKTGSSFLQTVFAQKKDFLINNGIFFPVAREGRNMLEAKISPGNGIKLVYSLRENDEHETLRLLEGWIKDADSEKCSSLLISAEGLFHTFSKDGTIKLLYDISLKLGIEDIKFLLFFRDPIKHAFSVYKHRGKHGKITDFKNWIKNDYETLNLTREFLNNYYDYKIDWHLRKYTSDSSLLIEIVFKEWLELSPPEIVEEKRVNASLTLSEILVLSEARRLVSHYSIREIYDSLIRLPNSEKANDAILKKYYSEVVYNALIGYNEVINDVNSVLPAKEKLEFKSVELGDRSYEEQISLSVSQLRILFGQIKKSSSYRIRFISLFKKTVRSIIHFVNK